ncbi:MAG: 1-phosphofructokinase family hexose kinase [Lachnospiraceae bacterium]|nr:1-phosphofructokinase family hexose kinase [Lachnospiraceae bacterium]
MIYTVTLNPSLDYFAMTGSISEGHTNRTHDEYIVPGGKGLNVSMVLARLGTPSTAIAFTAGFTGAELTRLLKEEAVETETIDTGTGFTRINVKINNGRITEFNGAGIVLSAELTEALKIRLSGLSADDLLVLSGAVPSGADRTLYRDLMAASKAPAVLDTFGEALTEALPERPFLIKPNEEEIEGLAGRPVETEEDLREEMIKLQERGARNVMVSMGPRGAALLTETGSYFRCGVPGVPAGRPFNTVAAGDSMIAGFIHEYMRTGDYEKALRFAVATGTAAAYSEWLPDRAFIEFLIAEK